MDYATCQQARTALGLSDTSVDSNYYSGYARGCVSNSAGSIVFFNTNTGSSRDCGYNSYSCLCAPASYTHLTLPTISRVQSSSPTCALDTAHLCTSTPAMYRYEALRLCSPYAAHL